MKQALIVMWLVLLAGCGGGSGGTVDDPQPTPTPAPEPTPEPEPEPPPEPEPEPELARPVHIGECLDTAAEAELVRRVAGVMNLPPEAVRQTWIYCDAWTPGPDGRTFQEQGLRSIQCYADSWTFLIGCVNGVSLGGYRPGPVAMIRMSPETMDMLLDMAREQGLDPGSMPQPVLRCIWSLARLALVLVHEWHHAWRGLRHGDAMATEDRRVQALVMQEHGEWIREANWTGCPAPRRWDEMPPITERLSP